MARICQKQLDLELSSEFLVKREIPPLGKKGAKVRIGLENSKIEKWEDC
jgi:hypothetical protein